MKRSILLAFIGIYVAFGAAYSAVVETQPVFPNASGKVDIFFNADQGSGGLANFTGTVYLHIGVITSNSNSPSDWKYVQGNWGTSDAPEATRLSANRYQFTINDIRTFFDVPESEAILKLAMVFRNEDGSKSGRASNGGDIFVDLFDNSFQAKIINPSNNFIAKLNDSIHINGVANQQADLSLSLNGNPIQTASDSLIAYSFKATVPGNYEVVLKAKVNNDSIQDTINFVINPAKQTLALPAGVKLGINYDSPSQITLAIYAPYKEFIYVVGDFNDWKVDTNYFMKWSNPNTFWLTISGLTPGESYAFQYFVDGKIYVADPYSELILDPNNDGWISEETFPDLHPYPVGKANGVATLIEMDRPAFNWQVTDFTPAEVSKLNIYELLVRDFVATHNYQTLTDTLDYLENMGINAIELMPINEFEGNESWGYNPSFHMALDKYYGTPEAFKTFVDECHSRGIAVFLDVVYNHAFSQSPLCQLYWNSQEFRPAGNSPYANITAKHDFNVGYDLNHESPAVQLFIKQVMTYWLTEYKVDGFRFDLSKGFTQKNTLGDVGEWGKYDATRVANLTRIYDEVKAVNPDAYVILEHFADNAEEKILSQYGCLLWGNLNHECLEGAMGYSSNFSSADYKNRGWEDPHLVAFSESHDEERMMYKNLSFGKVDGNYSVKDFNTALDRIELNWVVFGCIPGPKMIWQFGELGYDYPINHNGRTGNKPIKWEYNAASNRHDVYEVYAEINKLRSTYDVFSTTDYAVNVNTSVKRVHLNSSTLNVLSVGNFGTQEAKVEANFQHTGMWYNYFTNDSLNVTDVNQELDLEAGEYQLWIDSAFNNNFSIGSVQSHGLRFKLYPNPTEGKLFILSDIAFDQIVIQELSGKEIDRINTSVKTSYLEIDTANLEAGAYFITLKTDNNFSTRKFLKY